MHFLYGWKNGIIYKSKNQALKNASLSLSNLFLKHNLES